MPKIIKFKVCAHSQKTAFLVLPAYAAQMQIATKEHQKQHRIEQNIVFWVSFGEKFKFVFKKYEKNTCDVVWGLFYEFFGAF